MIAKVKLDVPERENGFLKFGKDKIYRNKNKHTSIARCMLNLLLFFLLTYSKREIYVVQ